MNKRRIKLLHLITTFSVGGAEMHLLSLVENMPKDGFDITVAFFKEEAQEARSLVPDFQALGVNVVDLSMANRWNCSALWRLYRLMKKERFDILHTHLIRADLIGPLVAKFAGVPIAITSVHNNEVITYNLLVKSLLRIANCYVSQVIAISQAVKSSLIEGIGLSPSKVRVINYGIDTDSGGTEASNQRDEVRRRLGISSDAIVVGTVGRLAQVKGHRYLIEGFAQVHRTHPNTKLLIVGHDDEGLRPGLEKLAVRLGIGDELLLPGYMDGRLAMQAMDIFVLSSHLEGFGMVLLEAMLYKLPIVATNISAIPEIVVDGETGMLVPVADSEKLGQAIIYLLENPEKARKLAYRGRDHVFQRFSLGKMVEETVASYMETIGDDVAG